MVATYCALMAIVFAAGCIVCMTAQAVQDLISRIVGVPGDKGILHTACFLMLLGLSFAGGGLIAAVNGSASAGERMVASEVNISDAEEVKLVLHWAKFHPKLLYIPDTHDCDDFAIEYFYALRIAGFKAGVASSAKACHAWNCVELPDGRVIHWEPQTGMAYRSVPSDTRTIYDPEEIKNEWIHQTLMEGVWRYRLYAKLLY